MTASANLSPLELRAGLLERPRWAHGPLITATAVIVALCFVTVHALWNRLIEVPGAGAVWSSLAAIPVALVGLVGAVVLFAMLGAGDKPPREVRVTTSPAGLFVDGALVARRDALTAGAIGLHNGAGIVIEVHARRQRSLRLLLRRYEDARALLFALGLDVTQRAAVFRIPSLLVPYGAQPILVLSTLLLTLRFLHGFNLPDWFTLGATPTVFLTFFVLGAIPAAAEVRPDGVVVRWLGTRRFVAYQEMRQLSDGDLRRGDPIWVTTVELPLVAGGYLSIPVGMSWARGNEKGALILARIREAALHDAHRRASALSSGGRS